MATPVHTKRYIETWNSVTMCAATSNVDFAVDSADVSTSCDAQKAYLQGKYGWTAGNSGPADFAASGADATLFAGLTGGTAAYTIKPNTAATSATNPSYNGTAFVTSYGLSFDQANACQMTTAYQGTGVMTRSTS